MFPRSILRNPVRQYLRTIHTTPPRQNNIDWKGPFRTLGIRNPLSLAGGGLALTFFLTFPFWFKQPLPPSTTSQNDDLPAPVRGVRSADSSPSIAVRSVVDNPNPTQNFPEMIEWNGQRFRLVAFGLRTISFLRFKVYNVGLYIPEREYSVLPTHSLSHVDSEPWSTLIRIYSYPLLLRIIPVRDTDFSHLRDGFVKSTMSRLRRYPDGDERKDNLEESIVKFKSLFPKAKLKIGEVLSIVQSGPELRLIVGDDMQEDLGGVRNDDLARGLMSAYLVGANVVCPDLQKNLADKILQIAEETETQK
jgi:hypothetical protein